MRYFRFLGARLLSLCYLFVFVGFIHLLFHLTFSFYLFLIIFFVLSDSRHFIYLITGYGLMLLWFTDLMNVTEEVTIS